MLAKLKGLAAWRFQGISSQARVSIDNLLLDEIHYGEGETSQACNVAASCLGESDSRVVRSMTILMTIMPFTVTSSSRPMIATNRLSNYCHLPLPSVPATISASTVYPTVVSCRRSNNSSRYLTRAQNVASKRLTCSAEFAHACKRHLC